MSRRARLIVCLAVITLGGIVSWAYLAKVPCTANPDFLDRASVTLAQQLVNVPPPIAEGKYPALETFLQLLSPGRGTREAALQEIESRWQPGNAAMLLEVGRLLGGPLPHDFVELLQKKTNQRIGGSGQQWFRYLWNQHYEPHPQHAALKAKIYSQIDPRFDEYFDNDRASTIRLDEIMWGGVVRDGIPPLKNPQMLPASQASYLGDSNVVFGIEINGDARAYPKRVLAWHEMFKDTVGGISINGVYCTLCGSMIVYETVFGGKHYELGTSGFLYRSNKLMYDHKTKSMWSTLTGQPVVGPLVGQGIELKRLHVVTTTWGEWRKRHPNTTVLSLNTGHRRDYGEGVAYRNYFATDRLMFQVPFTDDRLKNKQEVLALRFDANSPDEQLAIDTDYLLKHPVYHGTLGKQSFVVLTNPAGENRVYDPQGVQFVSWDGLNLAVDQQGTAWQLGEAGLTNPQGQVLPRLPAHRAFWFGWHAAFPKTQLKK